MPSAKNDNFYQHLDGTSSVFRSHGSFPADVTHQPDSLAKKIAEHTGLPDLCRGTKTKNLLNDWDMVLALAVECGLKK